MVDSGASTLTSQQALQQGSTRCLARRRDGGECGMTPTIMSGGRYCPKHDPDRQHLLSTEGQLAGRASHAPHSSIEVQAWADTLDFSTEESRARGLCEVARLVAQGGLTPSQGATIAALARAAAPQHGLKPPKQAPQIIVETGQ